MSMLADRRDKTKYILVPKGKALYQDESRFGTRMLKKMGWSEGKGLGANEDGNKEFIRIRYKNDSMGFGYDNRDDQWTQHEEYFTDLLKSLNENSNDDGDTTKISNVNGDNSKSRNEEREEINSENDDQPNKKIHKNSNGDEKSLKWNLTSGESLEEKSKKSKARVHYKKFTRSKDLSRYSEKDLANIFGKKSLEINIAYQHNDSKEEEEKEEDTIQFNENFKSSSVNISDTSVQFGVHKKSNKSLEDYFNEKMKSIKAKQNQNNSSDVNFTECVTMKMDNDDGNSCIIENTTILNESKGILNKEDKKKKRKYKENPEEQMEEIMNDAAIDNSKKKKKKSKKDKIDDKMNSCEVLESKNDEITLSGIESSSNNSIECKRKTKHKRKSQNVESTEEEINRQQINQEKALSNPVEKESMVEENEKETKKDNEIDEEKMKNIDNLLSDTYTTNTFSLEKFRHVAFDNFIGSNIKEIIGYGFKNEFSIEIESKPIKANRILDMWDEMEKINKYIKYKPNKSIKISNNQTENGNQNDDVAADAPVSKYKLRLKIENKRKKQMRRNIFTI